MNRAHVWTWVGGMAGVALWAGCNQILGTGEPIVTESSAAATGDTGGGTGGGGTGGTGGASTTLGTGGTGGTMSNGGGGTTSQGGAGGCPADPEWAQWVFPEPPAANRFTPDGSGIYKDLWTKLRWSSNVDASNVPADEAETHCQMLGGRLPTRIELLSLVNYAILGASKLHTGFLGGGPYWTSTVSGQNRWVVDFDTGKAGPASAGTLAHVRCLHP